MSESNDTEAPVDGPDRGNVKKYYTNEELRRPLSRNEIPRNFYAFQSSFGIETSRRNNMFYLDKKVLVMATGNSVQFIDIDTWTKRYLFGRDGGGIGSVTVHPSGQYLAVAEKGIKPKIYIYDYPQLLVRKVLRNGTERAYCGLNFSHNGEKLASIGGSPDFLLTIWDWKEERVILHCKAFGQDVFSVSFAPASDGYLTTSGTGHIRFWKMANTFTGLKLQGSIGKFGKVELSDIEAFCMFPDGKVLSSTERGSLLLWDGNFIKCEILHPERKLPHDGAVNVVQLDKEAKQVVTAGADGVIKWWSLEKLEAADALDDDTVALVEAEKEQLVGHGVCITGVLKGTDHYIIQDSGGALYQLMMETNVVQVINKFHAGAVTGLATSPTQHFAATCAEDGTLCCWDYISSRRLFKQTHPVAATCLTWAPLTVDSQGKTIAVGFADGTVRIYVRGSIDWKLFKVYKPHTASVTCIEFPPDGAHMVTGSEDETLFIFRLPDHCDILVAQEHLPIGFINLKSPIRSLDFSADSNRVLVACANGIICEFEIPEEVRQDVESYELDLSIRYFDFKRKRQLTSSELQELESDDALLHEYVGSANQVTSKNTRDIFTQIVQAATLEAISAVFCADGSDMFLVTMGKEHGNFIYKCSWDNEYPVAQYSNNEAGDTEIYYSRSKKVILCGCVKGEVRLRSAKNSTAYLRYFLHDGSTGRRNRVATSFNDAYLLSAGGDGTLVIGRIHLSSILRLSDQIEQAVRKRTSESMLAGVAAETSAKAAIDKVAAENQAKQAAGEDIGPPKEKLIDPRLASALAAASVDEQVFAGEVVEEDGDGSVRVVPPMTGDEMFKTEVPSDLGTDSEIAGLASADDIDGSKAYSIQDAKLKQEQDIRLTAADQKKVSIRDVVRGLQNELEALRREHEAEPREKQLKPEEFDVDPDYTEMLHEEGAAQVEELVKEMEFEREKSHIALAKLKRKYLDELAVELITLHSFASGHTVQTFRCKILSESLQERLRDLHTLIESETDRSKLAHLTTLLPDHPSLCPSKLAPNTSADGQAAPGTSNPLQATAGPGADTLSKDGGANIGAASARPSGSGGDTDEKTVDPAKAFGFEVRKQMRQHRKERMEALVSQKPGEDTEDPRDLMAIALAKENMGDYKLKSAKSYVVPEAQRVNATKKRQQMLLLEEHVHFLKMNFNRRFLELRHLKQRIVQDLQSEMDRLHTIERELETYDKENYKKEKQGGETNGDNYAVQIARPEVDLSEWPEYRENVEHEGNRDEKQGPNEATTPSEGPSSSKLRVIELIKDATPQSEEQQSEAEVNARTIRIEELRFEQNAICHSINQTISAFDTGIRNLRYEKSHLDVELKKIELRVMVLDQELHLLETFESKDNLLAAKLEKCKHERDGIMYEINEGTEQLNLKKQALAELNERGKDIDLTTIVNESHSHYQSLLKIFKRKIKRSKKRQNAGDDDNENEDGNEFDEDEDDDYDEDEDDDYDDDDEQDVCPAGCDAVLYEKVLAFRETRLDHEENVAEVVKAIEELTKSVERFTQKLRQMDKEFNQTQAEIQTFQTQKQQHFNQIDVVISLSLNQLRALESDEPEAQENPEVQPNEDEQEGATEGQEEEELKWLASAYLTTDVTDCLVFSHSCFERLHNRIGQLNLENKTLRQQFKDLHKQQLRLAKEKKLQQEQIALSIQKCNDLQMLKFGRLIDIEALDKAAVSKQILDLQTQIQGKERKNQRHLHQLRSTQQDIKYQILQATEKNTHLLEAIAQASKEQFELEKQLNEADIESAICDNTPQMKKEIEERNRMVELVKLQAKEIEALKAEIGILSNKSGRLYAPTPATASLATEPRLPSTTDEAAVAAGFVPAPSSFPN